MGAFLNRRSALLSLALAALPLTPAVAEGALSSWTDSETKTKILAFTEAAADAASPGFIPEDARIAVFDIDGTLWSEKPFYPDAAFAGDRIAAIAAEHPEWAGKLPFAPIVAGNMDVLNYIAAEDFVRLLAAGQDGLTLEAFHAVVADWFATVENPVKKKPQSKLTYQPMLELLALLEEKGFTTYLVTGANEEFIRAVSDKIFGIPPERVIGSGLEIEAAETDSGDVAVTFGPAVGTDNNGAGKVVQIVETTGRKPVFAAGNSDGDYMMMRWTTTGDTPAMAVLVFHDDAEREFEASRPKRGSAAVESQDDWFGISMKTDWAAVYPE